jgi:hypothetical protein
MLGFKPHARSIMVTPGQPSTISGLAAHNAQFESRRDIGPGVQFKART